MVKRPAKLEKDAEKRKIAVVVAILFVTVVTFLIFGKNMTRRVLYFLCGLRMLDTTRCMNEPFETIFPTFVYFFLSPGWIIYEMDHSERFDEFNGFLTIKN